MQRHRSKPAQPHALVPLTLWVGLALSTMATHGRAQAVNSPPSAVVDRVEITSRSIVAAQPQQFPGAFQALDRSDLEARQPHSILEALRELPGLHMVSEDTAGTHLNIGVRGLNPRRSSRVLLLEDGAPTVFFATYADPSSHYSTPLDRVERIELVKGAGQVLYGPQTLGGMLNFVTQAVPRTGWAGGGRLAVGNQGVRDLHAHVGAGAAGGGFRIDALQREGDGIRSEHGVRLQDLALKAEVPLGSRQRLTGKWSRFEERSRFSETGLTAAEWSLRSPGIPGSTGERFDMERTTAQLIHQWDWAPGVRLTTQAYSSSVFRQSTRLREFEPDDADLGLGALEEDPAIRPRRYRIRGVEPRLVVDRSVLGTTGQFTLGLRHHTEDVDRQKFLTEGLGGPIAAADERLTVRIRARSAYLQNSFVWQAWSFSQGLRIEDIAQDKRLFGASETDGLRFDSQALSRLTTHKRQSLPSLGVTWNGHRDLTVFAGIHKGIAPPRPDRDVVDTTLQRVQPELATIAELGVRGRSAGGLQWGATLFQMQVHDVVVQAGGIFRNEGEARHAGVEFDARANLGRWLTGQEGPWSVALQYTFLPTARFLGSGTVGGEGEDGYGSYQAGNRMPYAPRHSLSVRNTWRLSPALSLRLGLSHISRQFANTENVKGDQAPGFCPAGSAPADDLFCGLYGTVAPTTLFDAGVQYAPKGASWSVYGAVENLTDRRGIASRTNGLQPLRGRLMTAGLRWSF